MPSPAPGGENRPVSFRVKKLRDTKRGESERKLKKEERKRKNLSLKGKINTKKQK
jgi:hypothetical protein